MARRMATEQPVYDLILLLDPETEEERRTNILASLEQVIERQGNIVSRHDWGLRPTAYEIRKRAEADYHLLQFQGTSELLNQLTHALKITDGVNRFRIIKLRKGTPDPPDLRMSARGRWLPSSRSRSSADSGGFATACNKAVKNSAQDATLAGDTPSPPIDSATREICKVRKGALSGRHQHQPRRADRQSDA